MKAQIIQIGNSQGVRLPKMLLEETGIAGEVELSLHPDGIIIRRARKPRDGWDNAFKTIAELDGEDLTNIGGTTRFAKTEWKW